MIRSPNEALLHILALCMTDAPNLREQITAAAQAGLDLQPAVLQQHWIGERLANWVPTQ